MYEGFVIVLGLQTDTKVVPQMRGYDLVWVRVAVDVLSAKVKVEYC